MPRLPGELAEFLRREEAVAVGARLDGALIGYSLCQRIHENPYPAVTFLET